MQLTVSYYNVSDYSLSNTKKFDDLLKFYKHAFVEEFRSNHHIIYRINDDVLFAASPDDMIYDLNLDTVQKYIELEHLLISFYDQDDISVLVNLKKNFTSFCGKSLKVLKDGYQYNNIYGLWSVDFGYQEYDDFTANVHTQFIASNLDQTRLLIMVNPDYDSAKARIDFRPISDIVSYTGRLAQKDGSNYVHMCSYSTVPLRQEYLCQF